MILELGCKFPDTGLQAAPVFIFRIPAPQSGLLPVGGVFGLPGQTVVLAHPGDGIHQVGKARVVARTRLPAEIEVYAGTNHGWCPPDAAVYDHDQAEKAWSRQLALFKTALG